MAFKICAVSQVFPGVRNPLGNFGEDFEGLGIFPEIGVSLRILLVVLLVVTDGY